MRFCKTFLDEQPGALVHLRLVLECGMHLPGQVELSLRGQPDLRADCVYNDTRLLLRKLRKSYLDSFLEDCSRFFYAKRLHASISAELDVSRNLDKNFEPNAVLVYSVPISSGEEWGIFLQSAGVHSQDLLNIFFLQTSPNSQPEVERSIGRLRFSEGDLVCLPDISDCRRWYPTQLPPEQLVKIALWDRLAPGNRDAQEITIIKEFVQSVADFCFRLPCELRPVVQQLGKKLPLGTLLAQKDLGSFHIMSERGSRIHPESGIVDILCDENDGNYYATWTVRLSGT